jgi:hypothetical protein
MRLSKHAESRVRSRSIEDLSILLVKRFGHSAKSRDNSEILIANKRACREILRKLKAMQQNFERPDPLYVVVAADGTVITAGRRTRKIRRR